MHSEDRPLLVEGLLRPKDLVTYRKGELALNPVTGELITLSSEMIKICGIDLEGQCIYFSQSDNACTIYEKRPLECRLLKCWDTQPIEQLFLKDLLNRGDVIPPGSLLADLIKSYEKAFPVGLLADISMSLIKDEDDRSEEKSRLLESDKSFRRMACDRLGIDQQSCNFFFGRPVSLLFEAMESLFYRKTDKK